MQHRFGEQSPTAVASAAPPASCDERARGSLCRRGARGSPSIARVIPHVARGVPARSGKAASPGAVTSGGAGERPGADQAVAATDADVVLGAKARDGDVDPRRPILARLGPHPRAAWPWCLPPSSGPPGPPGQARGQAFTRELGRPVRPAPRDASVLDRVRP